MKDQITAHDYELISAYLDNQLSDKERTLLESRLKTDPILQTEVHEISKTRLLLKSLPKLRAPRNYYIQAETVHTRPSLRMAPIFGIVSAVASLLLALVIFGSSFFSSSAPVAMAPAAQQPVETFNAPQESLRSEIAEVTPTQEAPITMLAAPPMATSTATISVINLGEPEIPTPTTIYLFAVPPTSTPENLSTLSEVQSEISIIDCEQYNDHGIYPTYAYPDECPSSTPTLTLTSTYSQTFQIELSTTSPTITDTLTPTPTPSPTPTETLTPTETPTPTPSPTPYPTEVPPAVEKSIPSEETESPSVLTEANPVLEAGNPTPEGQEQAVGTQNNTNFSFLNYILLTVEISLASIAIIAGMVAIILRIKAGR
jgi:hypothetical protein